MEYKIWLIEMKMAACLMAGLQMTLSLVTSIGSQQARTRKKRILCYVMEVEPHDFMSKLETGMIP